eukprot:6929434-Prymnesium_polylepis.1
MATCVWQQRSPDMFGNSLLPTRLAKEPLLPTHLAKEPSSPDACAHTVALPWAGFTWQGPGASGAAEGEECARDATGDDLNPEGDLLIAC